MLLDLPHHLGTTVCGNGSRLDRSVALNEAEDDHFTGCAPTAFALAMPAKGGFVAFDVPGKRFTKLLFVGAAGTDQSIESFLGRTAGIVTETLPVNGHAKGKKFNEATFGRFRKTA